jgi:hypothetical protein
MSLITFTIICEERPTCNSVARLLTFSIGCKSDIQTSPKQLESRESVVNAACHAASSIDSEESDSNNATA